MQIVRIVRGVPVAGQDEWCHAGDDAPLPDGIPATISLARWRAGRDGLCRRNAPLGIRLDSHDAPDELSGELERFALIAIDFASLGDGRPYSAARLLRERWGYGGELRAAGRFMREQLFLMARCGFDSFELADAAAGISGFGEISIAYQRLEASVLTEPALAGVGRYTPLS